MPWWNAEMNRGETRVAHRRHLLAQEDVAGEVEPGLGCEPGQREQQQRRAEDEPKAVATRPVDEGSAVAAYRRKRQGERHADAERGQCVDPPRVEVVLVDDTRHRDERAEPDRRPHESPRPAGDRRERDRTERQRIVENGQRPREPALEIAGRVDVVERLRRQPRVRDEDGQQLQAVQRPDGERLA